MKSKVYGIIALGVAGISFADRSDRSINYTEVNAKITKYENRCTIGSTSRGSKRALVDKKTGDPLYMDCDIAKLIAPKYGYSKHNIVKHIKFTYKYQSPVDGKFYTDVATQEIVFKEFRLGKNVQVYAHKENPNKSRYR